MKRNLMKNILWECILIIFLSFALFVSNREMNIITAVFLLIYALAMSFSFKKVLASSIRKKELAIFMAGLSSIYILFLYLLGIFFGYNDSLLQYKTRITWQYYIVPITVIIVAQEYIRSVLLKEKSDVYIFSKKINIVSILCFIAMVMVDLIVYAKIYDLNDMQSFLKVVGFIFFASISTNVLFNHISKQYGKTSIIVYRLLISLYMYFIPVTPNIYIFLESFIRMVYPVVVYSVIDKIFNKQQEVKSIRKTKLANILFTIAIIIMVGFIMIISCKFKYRAIVVGSGSMTGTINKGDVAFYEKYEKMTLEKGDIIIFEKEGKRFVHRIANKINYNGEIQYITKGDANEVEDDWKVVDSEIEGVLLKRIPYIGCPTLWINEMFEK